MSKTTAHLIIGVLDMAAIFALYWLVSEFLNLSAAFENTSDVIRYNDKTPWLIGALLIPIFHIFTIFEAFNPQIVTKKLNSTISKVVVIFLALAFASAFIIKSSVTEKLELKGYHYCDEASFRGTISNILFYVKDIQKCSKALAD